MASLITRVSSFVFHDWNHGDNIKSHDKYPWAIKELNKWDKIHDL